MPLRPICLLIFLCGCVPGMREPTCEENIGTLDDAGDPVVWESCVARQRSVAYLVFSVETSGMLLLEHLTALSEVAGFMDPDEAIFFRIDEQGDGAVSRTGPLFTRYSTISGRQYYLADIEEGTYVIKKVPFFDDGGQFGRFEASLAFRSHRRRSEEVEAIVERFESEGAMILGVPLDTSEVPIILDEGWIISCSLGRRRIELGAQTWERLSPLERELALFHELGHCYLGRHHDNAIRENGHPKSIMAEEGFPDVVYRDYREEYIWELFDPKTFGTLMVPLIRSEEWGRNIGQ